MSTIWQDKRGSRLGDDRRNIRAHHRVVGVSPSSACDCLLIRLLHAGRRQTDPMLLRLISSYFMARSRAFCNRKKRRISLPCDYTRAKAASFHLHAANKRIWTPDCQICVSSFVARAARSSHWSHGREKSIFFLADYSAARRASQASDPMTFGHDGCHHKSRLPPTAETTTNATLH